MLRFKDLTNVFVKCTSLYQFATTNEGANNIALYRPAIEFVEANFGVYQMLFGGNFPNPKKSDFYKKDIDLWRSYFEGRDKDASSFFIDNAVKNYSIL